MSLDEAASRGIKELWRPPWNAYARMEIQVMDGGQYGRWGILVDPPTNRSMGFPAETPTVVSLRPPDAIMAGEDTWEPWEKPADYDRKFGRKPDGG